ncbi:MAG: YciI family protein [Candidatus Saccharibacteria bacterium]
MTFKSFFLAFFLLALTLQSFSQREFKTKGGDTTYVMKRYVFMLLNKGPQQDQDSVTLNKMMEGHMKHINEMAATKKLVVAGPFENGDKYRGILIFDVDSIAEALRMEATDPAVAGGRFEMQAIYWWAAKGSKLP